MSDLMYHEYKSRDDDKIRGKRIYVKSTERGGCRALIHMDKVFMSPGWHVFADPDGANVKVATFKSQKIAEAYVEANFANGSMPRLDWVGRFFRWIFS